MTKPKQDLKSKDLSIQFVPSKRKKVSKVFITIEGSIVVNQIATIKDALLPAIKEYDILNISLQNITSIDTAGAQLLYYISKEKEDITIDSSLAEIDRRLISVAGFSEFLHKPKLVDHVA